MQTFKYKAVSKEGRRVSGFVEAFNEYEAVSKLKETCSVVTKIAEVRRKGIEREDLLSGRLSEKSLAVMCSQFSIILGAGLPIVRAVDLIADQTSDKALKKILKQTVGDVTAGLGLAQSFQNKGKSFPVTFIETVRSGEESGTLDVAFRRLHEYYDKSSKMKSKVRSAMTYPVFTIFVAIVVFVIIMVVAVPAFTTSFSSMGVQLPAITRALIAMSGFFTKYWAVLAGAIIGVAIAYQLYGRTEKGRLSGARLKLRLPVLGRINMMRASAQFAITMSTLMAAGLPVLRSVSVTARVMDNYWINSNISRQLPSLEEGKTLNACLRAAGVLPDLLVEMTGIGEETGTMENTLNTIGAYYDNETELASQKALTMLEPIIICFLAVIVAFVLLSVYLPMFSLYSNIG